MRQKNIPLIATLALIPICICSILFSAFCLVSYFVTFPSTPTPTEIEPLLRSNTIIPIETNTEPAPTETQNIDTPTPSLTPTITQTPTITPTPTPPCLCTSDLYNCSDFPGHNSAQACYNYCKSLGYGDIHRLDGDNNGIACENQ